MGYQFEIVKIPVGGGEFSEALRVYDVEVMGPVVKAERPDFRLPFDIDGTWFQKAIATFNDRQAKGKNTYLLERHNKPELEADVIGRLERLRWEEPWLMADLLITNPEAIAKARRGEFPTRSAEFIPERFLVWGLSLIGGEEGHFDEELPDLLLADEELAKLAGLTTESLRNCKTALALEMKEMDKKDDKKKLQMDPEFMAMFEEFQTTVMGRLDELATRISALEGKSSDEGGGGEGGGEGAGSESVAAAEALAKAKSLEGELWIERQVQMLRSKGVAPTDDEIRKTLSTLSTQEGREECVKRLAEKAVPTDDIEPDPSKGTEEEKKASLSAEYDRRFGSLPEKKQPFTKEAYIANGLRRFAKTGS